MPGDERFLSKEIVEKAYITGERFKELEQRIINLEAKYNADVHWAHEVNEKINKLQQQIIDVLKDQKKLNQKIDQKVKDLEQKTQKNGELIEANAKVNNDLLDYYERDYKRISALEKWKNEDMEGTHKEVHLEINKQHGEFYEQLSELRERIETLEEDIHSIKANILNWQDAWVNVSNSYLSFNDLATENREVLREFMDYFFENAYKTGLFGKELQKLNLIKERLGGGKDDNEQNIREGDSAVGIDRHLRAVENQSSLSDSTPAEPFCEMSPDDRHEFYEEGRWLICKYCSKTYEEIKAKEKEPKYWKYCPFLENICKENLKPEDICTKECSSLFIELIKKRVLENKIPVDQADLEFLLVNFPVDEYVEAEEWNILKKYDELNERYRSEEELNE